MPSIRYPNETNAETRREGRTRTRKTKKEKNEEEVIDGTEAKKKIRNRNRYCDGRGEESGKHRN